MSQYAVIILGINNMAEYNGYTIEAATVLIINEYIDKLNPDNSCDKEDCFIINGVWIDWVDRLIYIPVTKDFFKY